jgi:hypothetical protein
MRFYHRLFRVCELIKYNKTFRILITLYFVSKGILKRPILYLSDFFEKHRMSHYDKHLRYSSEHYS